MNNAEVETKLANYYHHVDNGGLDIEIVSVSVYQNVHLKIGTHYYNYPSTEAKIYLGSVKHDSALDILDGIGKACFAAIEKLKAQM